MSQQLLAAKLLGAVAKVLGNRGNRWYLFGAQAVVLWGTPRMTADVDITAEVALEDADAFAAEMIDAGFELRVPDLADFVRRTRVLPFVHRQTKIPLDVVLSGPGLEESILNRALTVSVEGIPIPVISPEDLIVTKTLAGRPKDLEDVQGILAEQSEALDLSQIRTTLGLLEQALDRSDLRPEFESILNRNKRS